jgi:hypothetical protein
MEGGQLARKVVRHLCAARAVPRDPRRDGDVIACGTNHEGLGPLQDGEVVDFEIQHIGRMRLNVVDPLKRTWEKGIYMGADSTNPDAVRRNRPQTPR